VRAAEPAGEQRTRADKRQPAEVGQERHTPDHDSGTGLGEDAKGHEERADVPHDERTR
jgi:hypothetical protein